MRLLVVILKDYAKVERLLLGLVEIGVTGATVLEGRGMGQILGGEMPIFAALRGLFPGSTADSHVILVATDAPRAEKALALVEQIAGPLDRPGAGIVFCVPLDGIRGLKPELPQRRP